MNKWVLLFSLSVMLIGCKEPTSVSRDELMKRTRHWKEPKLALWYYTGSDDDYHYFRFVDLGEMKDYRVKREEMDVDPPRPLSKNENEWLIMPWGPTGIPYP